MLYSPRYIKASQSDYTDKVQVKWQWGTARDALVDSFVLSRFNNATRLKEKEYIFDGGYDSRIATKGDGITGVDTCIFEDMDNIKQGVSYTYSVKSLRVNPTGTRISADSAFTTGYAKFSAPTNVSATENKTDVVLKWDSIRNQGTVDNFFIFFSTTEDGTYSNLEKTSTVVKPTDTTFTDNEIPQGTIRWYKVAAYNDVSNTGVLSTAVRGYALMDPIRNVSCWEGVNADTIKITWDTLPVYESYYVELSLDKELDSDGRLVNSFKQYGSFTNSTYTKDSIIYKVSADSLRGRIIYFKLWAQNQYGGSDPVLDSGYTKLKEPANFYLSRGTTLDSVKISFSPRAGNRVESYTIRLSTDKNKYTNANAEINIEGVTGSDTVKLVDKKGHYYYGSIQAISSLDNASSDLSIDSGYSRIPAVSAFNLTALSSGGIEISWDPVRIGGDSVSYNLYRAEDGPNFIPLVSEYYATPISEKIIYTDDGCMPGNKCTYYIVSKAWQRPKTSSKEIILSDTSVHRFIYAKIGSVSNFIQDTNAFSETKVSLKWNRRGDIDSYYIYRSSFADQGNADTIILGITSGSYYYLDDSDSISTQSGMLWHYWIKARKNGNFGELTPNTTQGLLAYTMPKKTSIVSVSEGVSSDTIGVVWNKVDYVSEYVLQYRIEGQTNWNELKTEDTFKTLRRSGENLQDGVKYQFRVYSVINVAKSSPRGNTHGFYERKMASDTSDIATGYVKFKNIENFLFQSAIDSIKSDTIKLSWEKIPASGIVYRIYRSESDNATNTEEIEAVTDTALYYDVRSLGKSDPEGGKRYYYWITAEKNILSGTKSDKQPVTTSESTNEHFAWSLLDAPKNGWASGKMKANGEDNNPDESYSDSIVIKWGKVENATSYIVKQKKNIIGASWGPIDVDVVTDTQYTWERSSDNQKGYKYKFKVTAKNDLCGESNPVYSSEFTGFAKLSAPRDVKVKQKENETGIYLSWDTIAGAEKYVVYQTENLSEGFEKLSEVSTQGGSSNTIDTSDLTMYPGTRRWYRIRAFNSETGGSDSSTIKDTVCPILPPQSLTATKGTSTSGITITWALNDRTMKVDGFYIYRLSPGSASDAEFSPSDTVGKVTSFRQSDGVARFTDVLGTPVKGGADTTRSGEKYLYALRTYKGDVYSEYTPASSQDTGWIALPTITGLTVPVVDADKDFKLKWNKSKSINKNICYVFKRIKWKKGRLDTTYQYEREGIKFTDTSAADYKNLENGMVYQYFVKAFNSSHIDNIEDVKTWAEANFASHKGLVSTNWSSPVFTGRRFATPTISVRKHLDSLKVDTIFASWTKNSNATSFRIEIDTTATFNSSELKPKEIANTNWIIDSLYFTSDAGLYKTQDYFFRMKLKNQEYDDDIWDSVTSDWSVVNSGWSKLIPPKGVSASRTIQDSIRVKWTAWNWEEPVEYIVDYVNASGVIGGGEKHSGDSLRYRSEFKEGENTIAVRTYHTKYGTSDSSEIVKGIGKQPAPTYTPGERPTKGKYLDSICFKIDEEAENINNQVVNYRIFISDKKDAEAIAYDDPDKGSYIASDTNVVSLKIDNRGFYSNQYGTKLYIRVSWAVGEGANIYSEKSAIDSGWTKLKAPENLHLMTLDAPQNTYATGIAWAESANSDSTIIWRKRASATIDDYVAIDTVASSITNYTDSLSAENRNKTYEYAVQAINELTNSASALSTPFTTYVKEIYKISDFNATKGTKADTIGFTWSGNLDSSYVILIDTVNTHTNIEAALINLKASVGKMWKVAENDCQSGRWYYFRIYLEGDENNSTNPQHCFTDSGYAGMGNIEREWIIVKNDTSLISLDIEGSNVGDSAYSEFDASTAISNDFISKVYLKKYNKQTTKYDNLGIMSGSSTIYRDTIKEDFGSITKYSLEFVNRIEPGKTLYFSTFTTLRKPTTVAWRTSTLALNNITIDVTKPEGNKDIDSIVLYRRAPRKSSENDTIIVAYKSGQNPNIIVDTASLIQGLFYNYTVAYYNTETGLSRVSAANVRAYAKLKSPQFISVWDGVDKDTIKLTWNKIEDAENGYYLLRDTSLAGDWSIYDTVEGYTGSRPIDTSYSDVSEYEQCKKIYYKVIARGCDTTSVFSECETKRGSRAYRGVENLVGVNVPQEDKVKLRFSLPSSVSLDESITLADFRKGVKLMRYDTIDSVYSTSSSYMISPSSFDVAENNNVYTITDNSNPKLRKLYFYKVILQVLGAQDPTNLSNMVKGWIFPPAVTNVVATSGDLDTVTVTWDKISKSTIYSDTVTSYTIARCDDGGNLLEKIIVGGNDSIFYDHADNGTEDLFQPGKDYKYYVLANISIKEDTVVGTVSQKSNITMTSDTSNIASGWAEMQPLASSKITVLDGNRIDQVSKEYPTSGEIDTVIGFRVDMSAKDYQKYSIVYKKLYNSSVPFDSIAYVDGNTETDYYDTITKAGQILHYRFKLGNDHLSENYTDTFAYTKLRPATELLEVTTNESYVKIRVALPKNNATVDSILLLRSSKDGDAQDTTIYEGVNTDYAFLIDSAGLQGTNYIYKVALYNNITGYSIFGKAVDTVGKEISAPKILDVYQGENEDTIKVTWSKIDGALKGYHLLRDSTGGDGLDNSDYDTLYSSTDRPTVTSETDTFYYDRTKYPAGKKIFYKVVSRGKDKISGRSEAKYGYLKYGGVKDLSVVGWSSNPKLDTIMMFWTIPKAVSWDSIYVSRLMNVDSANIADTLAAHRVSQEEMGSYLNYGLTVGDYREYEYTSTSNQLLIGQLYFYRVVVKSSNFLSTPSNIGIGYLKMPKVTGVSATKAKGDSIVVRWTKIPRVLNDSVDVYKIYRYDDANSTPKDIEVTGDKSQFIDYPSDSKFESTERGKNYSYYVVGVMDISQDTVVGSLERKFITQLIGANSDTVVGYANPDTAKIVSISKGTVADSVTIKYKSSAYVDKVELQRRASGEDSWGSSAHRTLLIGRTVEEGEENDSDIEYGKVYHYRIKSTKGSYENYSRVDSGWSLLKSPDSVKVLYNGQYSDRIQLQVFSSNSDAYVDTIMLIKYGASSGDRDTVKIAKPIISDGSYVVSDTQNVKQGLFYRYDVAFSNKLGVSSYTRAQNTKAFAKLDVPKLVSISRGEYVDSIKIVWNKVDDAYVGYRVYRDSVLGTNGRILANYQLLSYEIAQQNNSEDTVRGDNYRYSPGQYIYYTVQAVGHDTVSERSESDYGTCKYEGVQDLEFVGPKTDSMYFKWTVYTTLINPKFAFYKFDSIKNIDSITSTYKQEDLLAYGGNGSYYLKESPASSNLLIGNLYFYRCVVTVDNSVSDPSNTAFGYLSMPKITGLKASRGGEYLTAGDFTEYKDSIVLRWNRVSHVVNDSVSYYLVTRYTNSSIVGDARQILNGKDTVFTDYISTNKFESRTEKGQIYRYTIQACYVINEDTTREAGASPFSTTLTSPVGDTVVGYTYPDSVDMVEASQGTYVDSIKVSYTSGAYADSIVLERKGSNDIWVRVGLLNTMLSRNNSAECFDNNSEALKAGESYDYRATVHLRELSRISDTVTGYTKLGPPTNLKYIRSSQYNYKENKADTSGINIIWSPESDGDGYVIYFDTSSTVRGNGLSDSVKRSGTYDTTFFWVPSEFNNAQDSILRYSIAVKTYMKDNNNVLKYSDFSNQVTGAVVSKSVRGLSAAYNATVGIKKICVAWDNLPSGYKTDEVDKYIIYQADNTKNNNAFRPVASQDSRTDSMIYIDSAKTPVGSIYFYKVRVYYNNAKDSSVYSPISNGVYPPLGDLKLEASKDSAYQYLWFDSIPEVNSYKIYRTTDTLPLEKNPVATILASELSTKTTVSNGRAKWKDPEATAGKIYYYGMVVSKDISVDGTIYTLTTKDGFKAEDDVYGYIKSTIGVVDFDFCAGGLALSWPDDVRNFPVGIDPQEYELKRQLVGDENSEKESITEFITKAQIGSTNDSLLTVRDSGDRIFPTALAKGSKYDYTLISKKVSKVSAEHTMPIESPAMRMSYYYDWSHDSVSTNVSYSGSKGKFTNQIQVRFNKIKPKRPAGDYDINGITPDTVSYYRITRYLASQDISTGIVDTFYISEFTQEINETTGDVIYVLTDDRTTSKFAPLDEGKPYKYALQAIVNYSDNPIFNSNVLKGSTYGFLKLSPMDLKRVESYIEGGAILGAKIVWDFGAQKGTEYVIGRDTSSTFATGSESLDENTARWQDTLANGEENNTIVGDTLFKDYNLEVVNGEDKYSPFGKLRMGHTYFYRVAKKIGLTESAVYSDWSRSISFKYGQDSEGNYIVSTAVDFNDLAEQYNSGEITGDISVHLFNDVTFNRDSLLPLGNASYPFTGKFDGKGYKMTVVGIHDEKANVGIFGNVRGAIIRNVNVMHRATVSPANGGAEYVGGIVGYNSGDTKIDSVSVVIEKNFTANIGVGGLVGGGDGVLRANNDTVVISADLEGGVYAGGIVGNTIIPSEIVNCKVSADNIKATGNASYNYAYAGGFAGDFSGTVEKSKIENMLYVGAVASGKICYAGGLVGYESSAKSKYNNLRVGTVTNGIEAGNSSSSASVASAGYMVGYSKAILIDSISIPAVMNVTSYASGEGCAGGLVGKFENIEGSIKKVDLTLAGTISATSSSGDSYTGMLVGKVEKIATNSIGRASELSTLQGGKNAVKSEAPLGVAYVGGVAGYVTSSSFNALSVDNVIFSVNAKRAYVGGIVGKESLSGSKYDSIVVGSSVEFANELSNADTLYVGGLAGSSMMESISKTHINTNINLTASDFADKSVILGGLCGEVKNTSLELNNMDLTLGTFKIKAGNNSKIGSIAGEANIRKTNIDERTVGEINFAEFGIGKGSYVGGLYGIIAVVDSSIIDYNSRLVMSVTSSDRTEMSYVGGLFGKYSGAVPSTFIDTFSNITITLAGGGITAGGVMGWGKNAKITESRAKVQITGEENCGIVLGGLVGKLSGTSSIIKSSVREIILTKAEKIGGIIGEMDVVEEEGLKYSFSYNITTQSVDTLGLLVGDMKSGQIRASYTLGCDAAKGTTVGNFAGVMRGGAIYNSYSAKARQEKVFGVYTGGNYSGGIVAENKVLMSGDILGNNEWGLDSTFYYPYLKENKLDVSVYNSLKMDKRGDYYIITKPIQLDAIGDVRLVSNADYSRVSDISEGLKLTNKYVIDNVLDFSGYENYTPIGYFDRLLPFEGEIDGNYKVIKNITVGESREGESTERAVIAYMDNSNALVKNLRIVNANITATQNAAVLCGVLANGSVSQIVIDSSAVNCDGTVSGLLTGTMTGGSVRDILTRYNKVHALTNAGLIASTIVGTNSLASVDKVVSVVDSISSGARSVGGITSSAGSNSTIDSCFSIAKTLVGTAAYKVAKNDGGTLSNNYTVAETKLVIGNNSKWKIGVSASSENGKNVFFRGFNSFFRDDKRGFNTAPWKWDVGDRNCPYLLNFENADNLQMAETDLTGAATIVNKTLYIDNVAGLAMIQGYIDQIDTFILRTNITFGSEDDFSEGEGNFDPIPNFEEKVFDGQGHYIKGMNISSNEMCVGFITSLSNCTVRNLALIGCSVKGGVSSTRLGMITGLMSTSTVEDVYVGECTVDGSVAGERVGGISGSMGAGSSLSWSIALDNTIKSKAIAAGVVGEVFERGILKKCVTSMDSIVSAETDEDVKFRVAGGQNIGMTDNYAWNGNTYDINYVGSGNNDGGTFAFSRLLNSNFYQSANLNFIARPAWKGWKNGEWVCVPYLEGMSATECSPKVQRFEGGTGTSNTPFRIVNIKQLDLIRAFRGKYFVLEANLNFETEKFNNSDSDEDGNWTGIEDFYGNLNGNGYSISGMKVITPGGVNAGLIAQTYNSSSSEYAVNVRNLSFYNCDVQADPANDQNQSAGVLMGVVHKNSSTLVKNILVKNCNIVASSCAGAVIGYSYTTYRNTNLLSVMNKVRSLTSVAGGIVGYGDAIYLINSVAINDSVITDSTTPFIARILGKKVNFGTLSNNYSFRRTRLKNKNIVTKNLRTGDNADENGRSVSLLGFNRSFFANADFYAGDAWKWPEGNNRVHFVGKNVTPEIDEGIVDWSRVGITVDPHTFASGDGTFLNPYIVMTAVDLRNIQYGIEQYYKLGRNITITDPVFAPICNKEMPFAGSFNGDYYSISGITQGNEQVDNKVSGLFGYISALDQHREIKNLAICNSTINTDSSYIGMLAGFDESDEALKYRYSNLLLSNNKITGVFSAGGLIGQPDKGDFDKILVAGGYVVANQRSDGSAIAGGLFANIGSGATVDSCVVIVDSIVARGSDAEAGRILGYSAGAESKSIEKCYGWYFTEVNKNGTIHNVRDDNIEKVNGKNAYLLDFMSTNWWEDRGFVLNDGPWKFNDNRQEALAVAPALKNMENDTISTDRLKLPEKDGKRVISEASQLNILAAFPSYHYTFKQLEGESTIVIDMRDTSIWYNDLNGKESGNWTPPAEDFTGSLDGNFGAIVGLRVVPSTISKYQGFLRKIRGGTVQNLGIFRSTFVGNEDNVQGGLAGSVSGNAQLTKIWTNGNTFSGSKTGSVGGFVGEVTDANVNIDKIISAKNKVVDSSGHVGGAFGNITANAAVNRVAALGNVLPNGAKPVAGESSSSFDSYIYADSGSTSIDEKFISMTSTVYHLIVKELGDYFGDRNNPTVHSLWNNYYPSSEMDNITIRDLKDRYYPTLCKVSLLIDDGFLDPFLGSGTQADPFQVSDQFRLRAVGYAIKVNKGYWFKQTANIDMSNEDNFWPIGLQHDNNFLNVSTGGTGGKFNGRYNGDGYQITGIYNCVNSKAAGEIGLFVVANSDSVIIENVVLDSATFITSLGNVGGVVSSSEGKVEIKNCRVNRSTITTTQSGASAGAIVGRLSHASAILTNCLSVNNTVTASANGRAGGIIGQSSATTTNSVTVGGIITGTAAAGGITGGGNTNNCYTWEGVIVKN